MRQIAAMLLSVVMIISFSAYGQNQTSGVDDGSVDRKGTESTSAQSEAQSEASQADLVVPENFVLIKGGSFQMGSPENEV